MNLCAVIILYNPEEIGIETVLSNIQSYAPYMDRLYIIDNSPVEHSDIANKLEKCTYLVNKNIGGIGGAQNIGCKQALMDGYEWVMTMDQDTLFEPLQIQEYLHLVMEFIQQDTKAVSFSLGAENLTNTAHWSDFFKKRLRPIKRKIFGRKKLPPAMEYKDRCIASANILKLTAWSELQGFNEFLFIDQVDYEFCYRLRGKNYKIVKFNTVHMGQHFGEPHGFTLFRKKYLKYSPFRYYHCIRNSFIVKKQFPQHKKFYNKYLSDLFFDNCINSIHCIKNIKIFIKAYKAYKDFLKEQATKEL